MSKWFSVCSATSKGWRSIHVACMELRCEVPGGGWAEIVYPLANIPPQVITKGPL